MSRPLHAAARRWKVGIVVFVAIRTIYSLTFTFNGAVVACQLALGDSWLTSYDTGEDRAAAALKTRLLRRMADLERSETFLRSVEDEEKDIALHSSVAASSQYLDDLLSATAVQTAQNRRFNQTFCALDRLRQVHNKFLLDVTEYVRWQKTQLSRVVAQSAVEEARLRLDGLLNSDWLRYPRILFQMAITSAANTTSQNISIDGLNTEQFTVFLEAGDELKAIQQWTAAVDKRYTVQLCTYLAC